MMADDEWNDLRTGVYDFAVLECFLVERNRYMEKWVYR